MGKVKGKLTHVNSIIDGSTLGNRYNDTLMVRSGGYGRDPIGTGREAFNHIGSELTIDCSTVETLEEYEGTRVCGLRRVEGLHLFNDNVVVPDDLPTAVQLLRCSKVRRGSIGKGTGFHPLSVLTST